MWPLRLRGRTEGGDTAQKTHSTAYGLIRDVFVLRLRRACRRTCSEGNDDMAARSESRQKTELIQVRATPEEKEQLKARAAAFGVSMGELCRRTIFGTQPKSRVDQDAIQELAATRADLGRLGGLLKGWLAGSFPTAPRPSIEQVRTLLKQLETSQATVIATVKRVVRKTA